MILALVASLPALFESAPTASAVGQVHGRAADAHRAKLARERDAFARWLLRNAPQARIRLTYDTVLNGVSVELRGASVQALRNAPGVKSVLTPIWMRKALTEASG